MNWVQILVLLPSAVIHLLLTVGLALCAWIFLKKKQKLLQGSWHVPVVLACVVSLSLTANTWIGFHQLGVLANQGAATSGRASAPVDQVDPALRLRADFLQAVEQLVLAPSQINAEAKSSLFRRFAPLFVKGEKEKSFYANAIAQVYSCQRFFLEDALTSYRTKTSTKSLERVECEKAGGAFYNREKLISSEQVTENEKLIAAFASHQKIPDPSKKGGDLDERALRAAMDAQVLRVDAVRRIFE